MPFCEESQPDVRNAPRQHVKKTNKIKLHNNIIEFNKGKAEHSKHSPLQHIQNATANTTKTLFFFQNYKQ